MPIDSNIYFQNKGIDFGKVLDSYNQGLDNKVKMSDLAKKQKQEQQEQDKRNAYQAGFKKDANGNMVFDQNIAMSKLAEGGFGDSAYALQNEIEQRNQAKAQQEIENNLRRQQINSDANLKKQAFGLDSQKLDWEKDKALMESAKKNNAATLNSSDKQRYDNINMASKGIAGMRTALTNGDNTFSLIGDNDFTANRSRAVEAIGRMQSGGAIGVDEQKRFEKMLPTSMDSAEMQQKKLQALEDEMTARIQTMGLGENKTIPHGTVQDGYIFYGGDPADAKNWKRLK